jgi:hypothetical protein
MNEAAQKVSTAQLQRNAYLYVRQSTPRQVWENSESTARQHALRQRATALGWRQEEVVVIDSHLGQSSSSATGRAGLQKLLAEVSLGRAGLVPVGIGAETGPLQAVPAEWRSQLTAVLAGMVLRGWQEWRQA